MSRNAVRQVRFQHIQLGACGLLASATIMIPTTNDAMMLLLLALSFVGPVTVAHRFHQRQRALQDGIARHHPIQRHLQDDAAASVCSTLDTIFAEELLYEPDVFQPVCQCNDVNSVFDLVTGNNVPDRSERLAAINREVLANGWFVVDATTCDNTCTVCLQGDGSLCGRMTLTDRTELQLELQNNIGFTAEDFLGETGADGLLEQFHVVRSLITGESCFEGEEGTLCYSVHFGYEDPVGIPFAEFVGGDEEYCNVSLDGTECNSCTYDVEQQCLAADCTNLFPGARWGCQPTLDELAGPFLPILLITQPNHAPRNFSVGSCEVGEPSSSVGTPAVAIPTDTAIAAVPTSVPVTTGVVMSPPAPVGSIWSVDTTWTMNDPTEDAPIVAPNEAPVSTLTVTIPTDTQSMPTTDIAGPEVPMVGEIDTDTTSSAPYCHRALLFLGAILLACLIL